MSWVNGKWESSAEPLQSRNNVLVEKRERNMEEEVDLDTRKNLQGPGYRWGIWVLRPILSVVQ
jgi:hypothetical protein